MFHFVSFSGAFQSLSGAVPVPASLVASFVAA